MGLGEYSLARKLLTLTTKSKSLGIHTIPREAIAFSMGFSATFAATFDVSRTGTAIKTAFTQKFFVHTYTSSPQILAGFLKVLGRPEIFLQEGFRRDLEQRPNRIYFVPVEPNPPVPRAVSESSSVSIKEAVI